MQFIHDARLLPCPFCGCAVVRILPQAGGWMSVDCERCGATKREVTAHRETMISSWNMRAGHLSTSIECDDSGVDAEQERKNV